MFTEFDLRTIPKNSSKSRFIAFLLLVFLEFDKLDCVLFCENKTVFLVFLFVLKATTFYLAMNISIHDIQHLNNLLILLIKIGN